MACVLFSSLPLIPVWRDIVSCHSSALHFDLNLQFAFDGLRQVVSSKPESTEGRPWGQPLKKPAGAALNLG